MRRRQTRLAGGCLLLGLGLAPALADLPLFTQDFHPISERGFGDRQNSIAWSMAWFKGHLYVGTSRSASCAQVAVAETYIPGIRYPLHLPDIECPATTADLRLQAEIWRWSPDTEQWNRVFQCPADLEVPGAPGHFVARDTGYRDMRVFVEHDGTEALYVGATCSRDFHRGLPPPRLLRSVDGETFAPVPQDPGTFLGDLDTWGELTISGFNRLSEFDGKLIVGAGGAYGHAALIAAERPELGNDHWVRVTPPGMTITCMEPHAGHFYVAEGRRPDPGAAPFNIYRTDGQTLPYTLTPVVPAGGYRPITPSSTIVSFFSFNGQLWGGSNRPTELIRINPDDTWDLVVGKSRWTPHGYKAPLSGLGDGFDWPFNIHIHRMQAYEGWLYLGTNDFGNQPPFRSMPWWIPWTAAQHGFDLYRTRDGHYIYELTRSGFEQRSDDFTARNFAATPHGLFLGTGNAHFGLRVWQANPAGDPLVQPADRLECEPQGIGMLLHWGSSRDAVRYHLLMANWETRNTYQWITSTTDTVLYLPTQPASKGRMHIVVEGPSQIYSPPSNIVSTRPLGSPMTFSGLNTVLRQWGADPRLSSAAQSARNWVFQSNPAQAMAALTALKNPAGIGAAPLPPWHARDLDLYVDKLMRRLYLVQRGILNPFLVL